MFKIKNAVKILAVMLGVLLLFSGCADFDYAAEDLITPPRADDEMYDIQQALEEVAGAKYTLKYPTDGKYRSAYIVTDLMNTGEDNFVIAFYSSVGSTKTTTMHLNLLKKVDSQWISLSDISIAGIGVEKVEIIDLNNDGIKEIAVGWNIYGGVNKKVMVYNLDGVKLNPLIQEEYTDFICCDLEGKGKNKLLLLNHNTTTAVAMVRLYSFESDGVKQTGDCRLNGAVTSFSEPVVSKLSGGEPAVFIDAAKGNGMQTEVILYQNGELKAPFYNEDVLAGSATYRDTAVEIQDINSDGYLEIPLVESVKIPNVNLNTSELSPITKWCNYNGNELVPTVYTVMNYTDGYYIKLKSEWKGKITVVADTDLRQLTFNLWDLEAGAIKSELFKIKTVTDTEWDKENNSLSEYVEIGRNNGLVYTVKLGTYTGIEKTDLKELKSIFNFIG